MNQSERYALQGAAAFAAAAGASKLVGTAANAYRNRALEESGTAFNRSDRQNVLNKYEELTGYAAPNVTANTLPSGSSYSTPEGVSLNFPKASQFTLGHELGHQSITQGGGPMGWVQSNLYAGLNPNLVGIAAIGAAALAPSTRRAASLALGINYLNHSGRILSEMEATRRGLQYVNEAGYTTSPTTGALQVSNYLLAPAATGLAALGAGRFLRSFAEKL